MKERPIIFSGPMVRAILAGDKTQTRRLVTPQPMDLRSPPHPGEPDAVAMVRFDDDWAWKPLRLAYGAPGDRLWVVQSSGATKGHSLADRYWPLVHRTDGCWEWMGRTNRKLYGMLRSEGKHRSVHRLAWEMAHGQIPDGQHVLHRCDVPWCVKPEHLFLGSNDANIADKVAKGRAARVVGERNGQSKLSDDDVTEIRRMFYVEGFFQKDIAARFGVTQPHVSKVLGGSRRKSASGATERPLGSRTLEVTEVRVQRLQDISEEDARAEGVSSLARPGAGNDYYGGSYREGLHRAWDELNGKRAPWASNPWVWAISFRRVEP